MVVSVSCSLGKTTGSRSKKISFIRLTHNNIELIIDYFISNL